MIYEVCKPGDAAWDDRLRRIDKVFGHERAQWYFPPSKYALRPDPRFTPDYAPEQMIRMGVFGDAYFHGERGQSRWLMLQHRDPNRFAVRTRTGRTYARTRGGQCTEVNYFGRRASLEAEWWLERGLIFDADPLGWFEWYCWYSAGRRLQGYDQHQIQRWVDFKRRHLRMYQARPTDGTAQALLHWGITVFGQGGAL